MKNKQGFTTVWALLVLVVALVAVGFWSQAMHSEGNVAQGEQAATVAAAAGSSASNPLPLVLAVTSDPTTPVAGQLVMGSVGDRLAVFHFTNLSASENVKITALKVFENDNASGEQANFSNFQIWDGNNLLGTAGTPQKSVATSTPGPGYYYTLNLPTPAIVPAGNSISLVVTGDIATYSSGGATDGSIDTFEISTSPDPGNGTPEDVVVAYGMQTNKAAIVTLHQPMGNPQQILRSVMSVSTTPLGQQSGRGRTNPDYLGTITLTANPAGSVSFTKLVLTFGGSFPSSTSFLGGVTLLDHNGQNVTSDGGIVTVGNPCNGQNSCNIVWSFPNGFFIVQGSSYTFTVETNDSLGAPPQQNVALSLSAGMTSTSSVIYKDALDGSAVTVSLLPSEVPIPVNSVSFAPGS
jgi:hypothetical protein